MPEGFYTPELLNALFKNLPLVIFALDKDKKFVLANPAAGAHFSTAPEVLAGKLFGRIASGCASEKCFAAITAGLESTESTELEFFCRRHKAWFELLTTPSGDGIIVVLRDVSRRKMLEHRFDLFSRVVQQSPVSVVLTDINGNIEYVNTRFTEVTGYSYDEAIGQNPRILKSGAWSAEAYKELWTKILAGEEWVGEFHNRKKNGELYWERALITSIKDHEGNIANFVAIKEDISKTKLLEEELIQAKIKAENANKTKSTFLANMSHELRTPLNGILGFTELLKGKFFGDLNDTQQEYLDETEGCARHLLTVINDLLDISRIDSGGVDITPSSILLDDFLKSSQTMIRSDLSKREQEVLIEVPDQSLTAYADRQKLRQVVVHLLLHASRIAAVGEQIKLKVVPECCSHRISINFNPSASLGADLDKVFDESYLSDPTNEMPLGETGLGMALVRRLVEMQGGEVGVESGDDHSVTFWFTVLTGMPDSSNQVSKDSGADKTSSKVPSLKPHSILIAEDDETNILMLVSMLSIQGHTVRVARNGKEAVEAVATQMPEIVLLDMQMPVMDGFEAAGLIRDLPGGRELPIIAVTANTEHEMQRDCLLAGCSAVMPKPFHVQRLLSTLKAFLEPE